MKTTKYNFFQLHNTTTLWKRISISWTTSIKSCFLPRESPYKHSNTASHAPPRSRSGSSWHMMWSSTNPEEKSKVIKVHTYHHPIHTPIHTEPKKSLNIPKEYTHLLPRVYYDKLLVHTRMSEEILKGSLVNSV